MQQQVSIQVQGVPKGFLGPVPVARDGSLKPCFLTGPIGGHVRVMCERCPNSRWHRGSPAFLTLLKSAIHCSVWPGLWEQEEEGSGYLNQESLVFAMV